jgi:ribose transport system permease protein
MSTTENPSPKKGAADISDILDRQEMTWVQRLLGSQAFLVFLALIVAGIALSFGTDSFATGKNIFNITRNATFIAIIAIGMTFVIITGGIDLSVGSVMMLTMVICAKVMELGYGIEVGLFAAVVAALAIGFTNGMLIAYLGYPSFVVTLAMMSIARSLGMATSQNRTISKFGPDHELLIAIGRPLDLGFMSVSIPVLITLIIAAIAGFVLNFTAYGKYVMAVGGNEKAATATGVPVRQIKVSVYMVVALTAAICGIVRLSWGGAVSTNDGTALELQVIAATVIGGANLAGGAGTVFGALVGAGLLEMIRNSLPLIGIGTNWQGTFIGTIILFAITFERVKKMRSRS